MATQLLATLVTIGGDGVRLLALDRALQDEPDGDTKVQLHLVGRLEPLVREALGRELSPPEHLSNPVADKTTMQLATKAIVGVCIAGSRYDVCWRVAQMANLRAARPVASYKSSLQEYAPNKLVQYDVLEERGPPHDRTFVIRAKLNAVAGRPATGKSKKNAQEEAARLYLEQYAPHVLRAAADRKHRHALRQPTLPNVHLDAVPLLATRLGLSGDAQFDLSAALTHRSAHSVEPEWRARAGALAQVGSAVLRLDVLTRIFYDMATGYGRYPNPTLVAKACLSQAQLARIFAEADLSHAHIIDREHPVEHFRDRARADVVQALAAATFLRDRNVSCLSERLSEVDEFFSASVARLGSASSHTLADPKSRLQELLAPLDMAVTYDFAATVGKPHEASHTVTMRLRATTGAEFVVKRSGVPSRRDGEVRLATTTLAVGDLPPDLNEGTPAGRLASFLLQAGGNRLAKDASSALRDRQFAGFGLLSKRDWIGLDRWLTRLPRFVDEEGRDAWSRNLRGALRTFDRQLPSRTASDLLTVTDAVASLSAVAGSDLAGFDQLVSLISRCAMVIRLRTKERRTQTASGLTEEVLLLHGRRKRIETDIRDGETAVIERAGCFLALVDGFLANASSDAAWRLATRRAQSSIEVSLQVLGRDNDVVSPHPLAEFLTADMPLLEISQSPTMLRTTWLADPCEALAAVLCFSDPSTPLNELARLIHDLKNRLAAYRVSLRRADDALTEDTASLQSRAEASAHLDAARELCQSMLLVRGVTPRADVEPVDLAALINNYVSDLVRRRPVNVAVDVQTYPDVVVSTSPVLLRGCLENLVKNALEAMPSGGRLSIELDRPNDGLVGVTVRDSGPGFPPEFLDLLLRGEPVSSTKRTGSGLGLSTVRASLRQLGGHLAINSVPGETRIAMILPEGQQ